MKMILITIFLWYFVTMNPNSMHDREHGGFTYPRDCKSLSKFYEDSGWTVSVCYEKPEEK